MSEQSVRMPVLERPSPTANGHAAPGDAPRAEARRPRTRVIVAAGLLVAGLAAIGVWRMFLSGPAVPPGVIGVSGRIEGDASGATVLVSVSAWRFREQLS